MSLITVDDLATYMQANMDDNEEASATIVIDSVEGILEARLKRSLYAASIAGETYTPQSDYADKIFLKHTPVGGVTSISVDGSVIDNDLYNVYSWGVGELAVAGAGFESPVVEIDYTYAPNNFMLSAMTAIMYKACAREYKRVSEDLVGITALQIERYKVELEAEVFSKDDMAIINMFRRRTLVK